MLNGNSQTQIFHPALFSEHICVEARSSLLILMAMCSAIDPHLCLCHPSWVCPPTPGAPGEGIPEGVCWLTGQSSCMLAWPVPTCPPERARGHTGTSEGSGFHILTLLTIIRLQFSLSRLCMVGSHTYFLPLFSDPQHAMHSCIPEYPLCLGNGFLKSIILQTPVPNVFFITEFSLRDILS